MKDLSKFGVQELGAVEMKKVDGGNPIIEGAKWVGGYLLGKAADWAVENREKLAKARKRAMDRHQKLGGTTLDTKF